MFSTQDPSRYRAETLGPARETPAAEVDEPLCEASDDEAPDGARLLLAAEHLRLLVEQACEERVGIDWLDRVSNDLAFACELGEAVAQGRSVPFTRETDFAAELMIIADGTRPASLVRGGRLLSPGQLGDFGATFDRFMPHAVSSVRATGRLTCGGRHVGTGVLVTHPRSGAPVVLTAAHVVVGLQITVSGRGGSLLEIDFLGEIGTAGSNRHRLGRLLAIGGPGDWSTDYAVIALGDSSDGMPPPPPLEVDGDLGSVEPPAQVAVVSYPGLPAGAARAMWPEGAWREVFEGVWHLKRVSPARSVLGASEPLVRHDATTTSGSSGGALLSIGTGRLAAIHLGAGDGVNVALRASVPLGTALTCP